MIVNEMGRLLYRQGNCSHAEPLLAHVAEVRKKSLGIGELQTLMVIANVVDSKKRQSTFKRR